MRGEKVYKEIIRNKGLAGTGRKGRNNTLMAKRNDCLIARYYYYGTVKNKCFEEILRLLMLEFFLSAGTITNIIQEKTEQLQVLKQNDYSLYYYQTHWPHLKW